MDPAAPWANQATAAQAWDAAAARANQAALLTHLEDAKEKKERFRLAVESSTDKAKHAQGLERVSAAKAKQATAKQVEAEMEAERCWQVAMEAAAAAEKAIAKADGLKEKAEKAKKEAADIMEVAKGLRKHYRQKRTAVNIAMAAHEKQGKIVGSIKARLWVRCGISRRSKSMARTPVKK